MLPSRSHAGAAGGVRRPTPVSCLRQLRTRSPVRRPHPPAGHELLHNAPPTGPAVSRPSRLPRGMAAVIGDLVEFLRTRLGEDERTAKAATAGPWSRMGQRVLDPTPPSTLAEQAAVFGSALAMRAESPTRRVRPELDRHDRPEGREHPAPGCVIR
ncbi:DUF6221 family protein [Streptomyces sp. NPDC002889]|uniref:DUF6221 family protein n=1 Tax=Streptomyces sp. NPDC002889 TaxID=3364669 RepID=UPI0036B104FD